MGAMINGGISGQGNTQIINGKPYVMYSPQWYDAQRQDKIDKSVNAGEALGKGTKAAYDAMGNPADTSSSSGSLDGLRAVSGGVPRIGGPGGGGGYDSGGPATYTPGAVTHISKPDQSAAEAAVFGKAKDQVGQTTQGALTGLRSALAGRGMLGSGAEYRGTAGVFNKGQGEMGDVSRQQAVTHLQNEMDIDKANQAADITGRGQDISAAVGQRGQDIDRSLGMRGQDITQRGQDIQYEESQAQLKLTQSLQQAAQRQAILQGIMGAINGPTLY